MTALLRLRARRVAGAGALAALAVTAAAPVARANPYPPVPTHCARYVDGFDVGATLKTSCALTRALEDVLLAPGIDPYHPQNQTWHVRSGGRSVTFRCHAIITGEGAVTCRASHGRTVYFANQG